MTDITAAGAIPNGPINTAVIQPLLTRGGEVVVPAGSTFVTGPLNVGSNTRLIVDGTLQLAPGSNTHLLTLAGSNIKIEGIGTLDANRAAQQLQVNGGGPWSAAIFAATPEPTGQDPFVSGAMVAYNVKVEGVTLINAFHWPLSFSNVNRARVRDVEANNCGNSFQFSAGCVDCVADGLRIVGLGDIGFAFYGGTNCCGIYNSTVLNCAGSGISILMDSGSQQACGTTSIMGNRLGGNTGAGIAVNKGTDFVTAAMHVDATIVGNTIWGTQGPSVLVTCLADGVVVGNMLGPSNTQLMLIAPNCSNVVQYGNCIG